MSGAFLLPVMAAVFWGFNYLFAQRALEQVNAGTFWLLSGAVQLVIAILVIYFGTEDFNIKALAQPKFFWFFVATILAGIIAEACTIYAVASNGAAYAAFGELSYPLFIILFGYLIYGETNLTMMQMVGGTFILLGATLLTLSK